MDEILKVESMEFTADIAGALAETRVSAVGDVICAFIIAITEVMK